jgi:hypothetical protein
MQHSPFGAPRRITLVTAALLALVWLVIYSFTVSPSVNFIDSGELVTTLHEPGIAHPPGYPLYTLMGYVVSNLLWGEVAWRVNILSAFWGAMAVGVFFLLIVTLINYLSWRPAPVLRKEPARGRRARHATTVDEQKVPEERRALGLSISTLLTLSLAAGVASLLGASSTFWSRTAQAKMYSLHYFFIALLFLLTLSVRWAYERSDTAGMKRWLLGLSIGLGLSLSNHLMTTLLVPGLLICLLVGADPARRFRTLLKSWLYALPAVVLPVLLYLYLPFRSSQHPLMNWGTPDNWGDFWRHITGWQYGAYVVRTNEERAEIIGRLWNFGMEQWSWLTSLVLILCLVAGVLLARVSLPIFTATLTTALATFVFATFYGISEIEPYMVPLYMMLLLWLGTSGATIWQALQSRRDTAVKPEHSQTVARGGLAAAFLLLAVTTAWVQYPRQDHSNDRLAGQFVNNVLSELPRNSILITDYWDFYAPTIYLQNVLEHRPDVSIVDMSLLKYPWYMEHLQHTSRSLIQASIDLVAPYQIQQRTWLERPGNKLTPAESATLSKAYFDLLTSFVERSIEARQAYILFQRAAPGPGCESCQVAPNFERQKVGLTSKLVRKPAPTVPQLPDEPDFKLEGITTGRQVPMDEFARLNSCLYVEAYASLAPQYAAANNNEAATRMLARANSVREAIPGQCR